MTPSHEFDVIVVGGGIAGSALAGVLAQAGLGVLVVEREASFRDRIRGELTWPWGVAEARKLGLEDVLRQVGSVDLPAIAFYEDQHLAVTEAFDDVPMIGFSHPLLQAALFTWAEAQGATTVRPAKATDFERNGRPEVTVVTEGRLIEYTARLVVAADGKLSAARRWAEGETLSDVEHHRFGGVLVTGSPTPWRILGDARTPTVECIWFSQSVAATRLYLRMGADRVRLLGVDRSFAAFVQDAATLMPDGALENVQQAGPLGFFSNSNVWASKIAGDGVVLIGDAAGSADPSSGLGTSLLFRDVRELRDLLLTERDWAAATAEFAVRRERYYEPVREYDRWMGQLFAEEGAAADQRRVNHFRAREQDPTLCGWGLIEAIGPEGLVVDERARRVYFGEDLPAPV